MDIRVRLTRPQAEFVYSKARVTVFHGGVGSGKTFAGAVKALVTALENPKTRGLVVAPTYRILKDATLHTALQVWGEYVVSAVRSQDMSVEFINGSEVLFRSATHPDRLRGITCSWLWVDEAAYVSEDAYDVALGRLRGGISGGARVWLTTTPCGKNWVSRLSEAKYVRAPTGSNVFLPEDYLLALRERYSSAFALQELEGEFIDAEGAWVKREWLVIADHTCDEKRTVRFWDPAISGAPGSDYTASVRISEVDDHYHIGGLVLKRLNWDALVKEVVNTAAAEPGVPVYIEANAFQKALLHEVMKACPSSVVRPLVSRKSKADRAAPWIARLEAGKLVFLDDSDWREAFSQLLGFPNLPHDDAVDAISGAWEAIHERRSVGVF